MLDRTRSHKFVNAFASSSSVFVFVGVVICVFLLLGEFLLFVWVVEEDNSSKLINLKANTEYQVGISFLDETDPSDVEDITEEVIEEADDHQVFYDFSDVSISYSSGTNDTIDSDGNPVYLNSLWTASSSGSGIVQAFLIHEPTSKTGTSRDSFGGETDVAIDIPITISD